MSLNAILREDLVDLGLYIDEDDNYVYLKYKGEVVARWWVPTARLVAIRNVAQSWALRHAKEKISA